MSTQEIADRLVELYNDGKATQAEQELYANDAVSNEQDPTFEPTQGLEAIIAKTTMAGEMMETVHTNRAETVLVNHDSFLVIFDLDVEMKNGFKLSGKEYGFYKVKDGKVVEEYFYVLQK